MSAFLAGESDMVSTVRSRPNHYEMLGLAPDAGSDEIARAFAREIGRPRAFGAIAEVSIAYEVLRDPAKRRAYDAAIGLGPEPDPRDAVMAWRQDTQYFTRATPHPRSEPRTAAFIAASLRAPAEPAPRPDPQPEPEAAKRSEPPVAVAPAPRAAPDLRLDEAEERPGQWNRTAIVAGALIASAVLAGALAGSSIGNGEGAEPASEPAVTTALPAAKPAAAALPPDRVSGEAVAQRRREPRAPVKHRPAASPRIAQLAEAVQAEDSPLVETLTEQAIPTTAPTEAAPAAMPLSNAVVARTIHRIGYACGDVASTSAVEGARGVYTVACTSGASYQATPVHGRYRFRRVASH
jgi:hypothetical protein